VARGQKKTEQKNGNGATLGFEQALWASADKQRGHMDAAEYKHVVIYRCAEDGSFT
jgi:type I restriction enzyme M protein